MMPRTQMPASTRQGGIALVITLVLLLVMTMIAVVAMRSTTVDLKMTINTVLQRRAFQSSEGGRTAIRDILRKHIYNRGWPTDAAGGNGGTGNFDIPDEIIPVDLAGHLDSEANGVLEDLGPPSFDRPADIQYRSDINNDGEPSNTDMFADIWATWLSTPPNPGSSMQTNAGTTGNGVSNGGTSTLLDIRSLGDAPGNAEQLTGADFRVLNKN
jgi:PilX N-terminal